MKCLKENCIHNAVCALFTFSGYNSAECAFYETRRPHGEWKHDQFGDFFKSALCSNCDLRSAIEFPFCPNCGADMRKEGETND